MHINIGGRVVAVLAVAAFGLSACNSPGPSLGSVTCGKFAGLSLDDQLSVASQLMDASPIDPKGGGVDTASLGDSITAVCAQAAGATKVADIESSVVAVFLAQHPQDRA